MVALLLQHGAEVNIQTIEPWMPLQPAGDTPLHQAVDGYSNAPRKLPDVLATLRLLLDAGADLHIANAYGENPLFRACQWERLEVVTLLLQQGADPNARNRLQRPPLFRAMENYAYDTITPLLAHGAEIEVMDEEGITPLHWAANSPRLKLVRWLVELGLDVNARDNHWRTPLQLAEEPAPLADDYSRGGDSACEESKWPVIDYLRSVGGIR
jgi:ankyrin repeat protein